MADTSLAVAKACSNCAKAKSKCDGTTRGAKCHRCNRLNKNCVQQESLRKRKVPKLKRAAQIAVLEEKINGLLALQPQAQLCGEQSSQAIPNTHSLTPAATSILTPSDSDGSVAFPHPGDAQPFVPKSTPASDFGFHASLSQFSHSLHSPDEALSSYHKEVAATFPFVIIPKTMGAYRLSVEKPFVYKAIITVMAYTNTENHLSFSRQFLKQLTESLVLRGEKKFDMLQGLLIYLSWYHHFNHINHQMNNLLGLLAGLLVDLGLNSVLPPNDVQETITHFAGRAMGKVFAVAKQQLTLDEKRAYLGCYYISSCLTSSSSAKIDGLRFKPSINNYCDDIAAAKDYESDILLVYMINLRVLCEKHRTNGLWDISATSHLESYRSPTGVLVRHYQVELDDFRKSFPSYLLLNPLFAMQYYAVEIHLYEVCFRSPPSTKATNSFNSIQNFSVIWSCFQATRLLLNTFLAIPVTDYITVTASHIGQLFHALGTLYKLSMFDVPTWDVNVVRDDLNLPSILAQIAVKMEKLGNTYGPLEQDSGWSFCGRKLLLMKSWCESTFAPENTSYSEQTLPDITADELQAMMSFELLDENFWRFENNHLID